MDRLFPSEIHLSQLFFDFIVRQTVPVNLNCLQTLCRGPPGASNLPVLTCLTFSLTKLLSFTWQQVYTQHGPFSE